MHLSCAALLLALSLPSAFATNHTQCYTFFLKKDGCVHGTPGDKQCPAQDHLGTASAIALQSDKQKRSTHVLERRYDAYAPVSTKGFGKKVCPGQIQARDDQPGVCLWSGTNPADPDKGGWVSKLKNSNCGKEVWIQRTSGPASVYAPVVAECSFDQIFHPPTESNACFHIGLTSYTFNQFNPTAAERAAGQIDGMRWDFNNIPTAKIPAGTKPKNGPV